MFTRRKTGAAIVACAALMLTAAGCGGSDDGGGSGSDGTAGSGDTGGKTGGEEAGGLTGTGPITFATGKDLSGNMQKIVNNWNKMHPDQKVTITELPSSADDQRTRMVQNAQTKSDAYGVLNMDVVWTAEFAANQWVVEIPKGAVDNSQFIKATVDTTMYFNKQYAVPSASDGALLYYRSDLLKAAGVAKPPTTWNELKQACTKVQATPGGKGMPCYIGQMDKYEGLTCNASEFIHGAGGSLLNDQGKPDVNTEAAKAGLGQMAAWVKDGTIPKAALTYKEEESRTAFEGGKAIFMRQWPYAYELGQKSKLKGKFAVAPLPGKDGPGVSTLGGHNLAISAFTPNKKTALDFIKFFTGEEQQKGNALATSQAPTRAKLYNDAQVKAKYPYMPILLKSIQTAKGRPQAVKYGDVTSAIQQHSSAALNGADPSKSLADMQSALQKVIG